MPVANSPLAVVVLISGRGSNLQALIDARDRGDLPVELRAVVSNRPDADGLVLAQRAGIPGIIIDHSRFTDRSTFDAALQHCIDTFEPELLVLAGFMRLLTPGFCAHYSGRMLNIHPSLLPAYQGLRTHERVLADGVGEHGATVHFVTADLDGGPAVLQAVVPVRAGDDPQTLAARVLEQEHQILPCAVRWFAEGRLRMADHAAYLDGQRLYTPLRLRAGEPCP